MFEWPEVAGSGRLRLGIADNRDFGSRTDDGQSERFYGQVVGLYRLHAPARHRRFPGPDAQPRRAKRGFSVSAQSGSDLDPNNPRYQAANRVYQARLPFGGSPPPPTARRLAEEVKFAACIRQHGFPGFPDPNNHGVFVLNNFDLSSNRLQSARQTCRSLANFTGPMPVNATNSGPAAPAPH